MMKNLRFILMSMLVMLGASAFAEDIIWQEDFSSYAKDDVPAGGTYNYVSTDGASSTKIYQEALAGGEAPELLVSKKSSSADGGTFTATVNLGGKSGDMILSFKSNKKLAVTVTGGTLGEAAITGNDYVYPISGASGTLTIKFENTLTSNARLDNIKLYQGTAKKPAGLSWGKASTTLTLGEEVTLKLSNANNLPVAYSSSDPTVATIDQAGTITLVAAGKTLLTAEFAGNDEYEAQTVSIEVTVKEAGGGETPTIELITVAKALELINALEGGKTTADAYQVKGYIVGDPDFQRNKDNQLYGNVNFDIADEKGGSTKLTVFRAKSFENQAFTETTTSLLKAGDLVVIQGKLQKYVKNDETTPELTNGYLISVNGQTTFIEAVQAEAVEAPVYNLAGQRVEKAQKGLYIQNGKKFFVK